MDKEHHDIIVIGGGQAGLSVSYYLAREGREHIVLEQGRIGETWLSKRWDSFTLVTPNWTVQLPGSPYDEEDPDGFVLRDEVVAYLERYVESFNLPVRCGVRVNSLQQGPQGGYLLNAGQMTFEAKNVVVATGAFQVPKIPPMSSQIPSDILQIHTDGYRNPQSLPRGSVLIIGTGQSGCQIAEELNKSGRTVYLATSSCGRAPRRYRGKDIIWWMNKIGMLDDLVDKLPSPSGKFACNPHVSGKGGGHDINLRQLANDGVVLLGHLVGAGSKNHLSPKP
jgi:putative flavoprotein involved in K+ transport